MSIRATNFFSKWAKNVVVLGSWLKLREHKRNNLGRRLRHGMFSNTIPNVCVSTKSNLTKILNAFSLWEFDFQCGAWFEISNIILIQMRFESLERLSVSYNMVSSHFQSSHLGSRSYGQSKYCNENEKFNACSSRVSWMRAQMMFDWKDWYIIEKVISRIVR
jgi:hypothetical protein